MNFHKNCPREVSIARPLIFSPACYHRTTAAPTLNYNLKLYHYIFSYSPISHCKTTIFHETCPREVLIARPLTLSPARYHKTTAAPTLNYNLKFCVTIYSHTPGSAIVKQQLFTKLAPEKYRSLDPWPSVQHATTGPRLPQHLIITWNLYHNILSYPPISHC